MSIEPKIKSLITRRILGVDTPDEAMVVESWRQKKDQNEALFQSIADQDRLTTDLELYKKLDWEKVYSKVVTSSGNHIALFRRRMMQWAAIFVFAAVTSVSVYIFTHLDADPQTVAQQLVTPGAKARLIKSDGSVVDLTADGSFNFTEASSVDVKNEQGDLIVYSAQAEESTGEATHELVYNTLEIPRSGEYKLVLADGTRIWLNSQTTIKYPVTFSGEARDVYLTGEAYFDVAKGRQPFVVHTPEGSVQVLGTQFNVKAYLEDTEEAITLDEGSVRVTVNDGLFREITPGYQALITKRNKQLTAQAVDTRFYTGWRSGVFRFDGETLEGVMKVLARWYDFQYQFDTVSTQNLHFSGTLKRYDSAQKVFQMIEQTARVTISIEDEYVVIK